MTSSIRSTGSSRRNKNYYAVSVPQTVALPGIASCVPRSVLGMLVYVMLGEVATVIICDKFVSVDPDISELLLSFRE